VQRLLRPLLEREALEQDRGVIEDDAQEADDRVAEQRGARGLVEGVDIHHPCALGVDAGAQSLPPVVARRVHQQALVALREGLVQVHSQPIAYLGANAALEDHVSMRDPVAQPLGIRVIDRARGEAAVDRLAGVTAVGPQPAEAAEVRRILLTRRAQPAQRTPIPHLASDLFQHAGRA
jgi:hypothetical protein